MPQNQSQHDHAFRASSSGVGIDAAQRDHHVQILRKLDQSFSSTARIAKIMLYARAILLVISTLIGLASLIILIDYTIHLSAAMRSVLLIALLLCVYRCASRYLIPAIRFHLSSTQIAQSIEKLDPSKSQSLASLIDLYRETKNHPTEPDSNEAGSIEYMMRDQLLIHSAGRFDGIQLPSLLRWKSLSLSLFILSAIMIAPVYTSVFSPNTVQTGLTRVFIPWLDSRWPIRYPVIDQTNQSIRAMDLNIPISALIGKQDDNDHPSANIRWRIRSTSEIAQSQWVSTPLNEQPVRDETTGIKVFEQLVNIQSTIQRLKQASSASTEDSLLFEYTIRSSDDQTEIQRIVLVKPPELLQTHVEVTPPEYASRLSAANETPRIMDGSITYSSNTLSISPVLKNSRVRIEWTIDQELRSYQDSDTPRPTPAWIQSLRTNTKNLSVSYPSMGTVTAEFVATNSFVIEPELFDNRSIQVRDQIRFTIGVLEDQMPGAVFTLPTRDETISVNAVIDLKAEMSDDLGLSKVAIQGSVIPSLTNSANTSIDNSTYSDHDTLENIDLNISNEVVGSLIHTLDHLLDITQLNVSPGDELTLFAVAWDTQSTPDYPDRGRTISSPRVMRIESLETIQTQIREALTPLSASLRQLDTNQKNLQDQLKSGQLTRGQEQRILSEQIEVSARSIDQLSQRVEKNRLEDPILSQQLKDSQQFLNEASQSAKRAADEIEQQQVEKAQRSQDETRDQLGRALSLLDQGQDAWLAMRELYQLRDELREVNELTNDLSKALAEKGINELSANELTALDQILNRQLNLTQDAQDTIDTLEQQAQSLEEKDPTQAEALENAAQQAKRAELESRLQQAAEQIRNNQTNSASQTQQSVLEDLEDVIKELENSINNRDNALRRHLASLNESISSLIQTQETLNNQIQDSTLLNAMDRLDAPSRSHYGNTLAVRDQATSTFPETQSIANLIDSSAQSQSDSIQSFSSTPPNLAQSLQHARASLLHLQKALEEVNKLDEQAANRELQKLRDKLRDAYKHGLEEQVRLRDLTSQLLDEKGDSKNLNRRQRSVARKLAQEQAASQEVLQELITETEELSEAPIFKLAHAQLDQYMDLITNELNNRSPSLRVMSDHQSCITILQSLVEVLEEQAPESEEDFESGESSGSQGGSGSGEESLLPPVAQLILLRTMQEMAMNQTQRIVDQTDQATQEERQSVIDLQTQLSDHAKQLIEQMSQQNQPVQPQSSEGSENE